MQASLIFPTHVAEGCNLLPADRSGGFLKP